VHGLDLTDVVVGLVAVLTGLVHHTAPHRKVNVPQWTHRTFSSEWPIGRNFRQPHFWHATPFTVRVSVRVCWFIGGISFGS